MLVLNREAVIASLSHAECVDLMDAAMRVVSSRDVVMPLRQFMAVPDTKGKLGMMPGYLGKTNETEPSFGIKVVSKFPREPGSPLSSHVGAVLVVRNQRWPSHRVYGRPRTDSYPYLGDDGDGDPCSSPGRCSIGHVHWLR